MELIRQHKTNRFTLLLQLYVATNGFYDVVKDLRIIGEHNGISGNNFRSAFKYMTEEGLVELKTGEKGGDDEYYVSLSHKGIKALEEVFLDVNEDTYYFPAYREMKE